ncbi:MAG TPA: hypothetical protein VF433_13515 [Cellvibrio sp.]
MKKKVAGLSAAIASVVTALVGSQAFGENPWITNIVVGGLAITMVLNLFTSEDLSRDLRNGTFEQLIRDAIQRIAEDERTKLEIRPDDSREEDNSHG